MVFIGLFFFLASSVFCNEYEPPAWFKPGLTEQIIKSELQKLKVPFETKYSGRYSWTIKGILYEIDFDDLGFDMEINIPETSRINIKTVFAYFKSKYGEPTEEYDEGASWTMERNGWSYTVSIDRMYVEDVKNKTIQTIYVSITHEYEK